MKKIIAAGGLVTNNNNDLLMIFRRGKWDLPKGKLDEGETIEQCAVREVAEETGITNLELGGLLGITYHEYFDKYVNADVIKETHWYSMKATGNETFIPQTEEDIEKIIWADAAAVEECLQNSYANIVEIIKR
ncbi:MAG TPA: NUDIX domain-containing protein [Panacibacter sp.]|nr:hypothetical protein [Chitinophagaceae bacterium]HRI22410.1 NUDIX domain-containing protein [Panacibacter sp.]